MAAGGGEGAGFWLPSEFLTDGDFLMDKENFSKSDSTEPDPHSGFPAEFPYDSETRADRLLEKFWMMSTSPQSTLAHNLRSAGGSSNGSPSSVPSPPPTPFVARYDAVGDLICLAAGQVARLRLNRGYVDKSLSVPLRGHAQFYPEPKNEVPSVYVNTQFQQKQQNEGCGTLYNRRQIFQNRGGTALRGMGQAAWTLPQNPTYGRAVLTGGSSGGGGGAPAKRTSAGTGVFLPRRYENINNSNTHSSDSLWRTGANIQVHNKSKYSSSPWRFNHNGFCQSQTQPLPGFNQACIPDSDSLQARRPALVLQQRGSLIASLSEGSLMIGHDLYLPLEWMY